MKFLLSIVSILLFTACNDASSTHTTDVNMSQSTYDTQALQPKTANTQLQPPKPPSI